MESLLGLLDEGNLHADGGDDSCTGRCAERSVFQHFPDREALFEAVAREQYGRRARADPIGSSLPFEERVEQFAEQRARLYELIGASAGPRC